MIRVLIADDHAVVRQGLRQILADTSDMVVAGEAATGPEALERVYGDEYDVLVLDLNLPGRSGFDILKDLHADKPTLPVLILSMHAEEQFAGRLLKAGAAGYLNKTAGPDKLVDAVRQIAAGRKFITPELAQALAEHMSDADGDGRLLHDSLSDREFQTLRLIAAGRKLSEIAVEMSLSAKTVSVYRARLLEKMRMKSNAELTRYALQNRLVE